MGENEQLQEKLSECLQVANKSGQVRKGLNQVVKSIQKGKAQVCIIADGIDKKEYFNPVFGLCLQNKVPSISVKDQFRLAEIARVGRINRSDEMVKVGKCSAITIENFGFEKENKE